MTDAISRSAVLENARTIDSFGFAHLHYEGIMVVDVDDINDLPALDVVPVVHARWQDHHCTKCKNEAALLYECIGDDEGFAWYHSDFCPCCGARMDGEVE